MNTLLSASFNILKLYLQRIKVKISNMALIKLPVAFKILYFHFQFFTSRNLAMTRGVAKILHVLLNLLYFFIFTVV